MKILLLALSLVLGPVDRMAAALPDRDPAHISIHVSPFYDAEGPKVNIGRFSGGLASSDENKFLSTIGQMKRAWRELNFVELYVGAMRLYDLGYRKESVYWFYTAQYRGRQFSMLLDDAKRGGIGDVGYDLFYAQDAFYSLAGPYINGYAFGDTDALIETVARVQKEGRSIPDLQAIYPRVGFKPRAGWEIANAELADNMDKLITILKDQKEDFKRQRAEAGTDVKFSNLANKELPDG